MNTFAEKSKNSETEFNKSGKRQNSQVDPVAALSPVSVPISNFHIQRKANCACGGDCPTCEAKSSNLPISQPNDASEIEAEAMSVKVMRMEMPESMSLSPTKNSIQKKESQSDSISLAPPIARDVLSSGGKPLDANTRAFMEPRFNYDFGSVRIHDNDVAAKSASSINALAYTFGNNVVFSSGQYNTNSDSGKQLLAHELAHVMQQDQNSESGHTKIAPMIQRRLVTFGALPDVSAFLGLLGPSAGLTLGLEPLTSQVVINAVLPGAPPSATLRARLTAIINNAAQHAEVVVARGQPLVFVGAFPQPEDLTVTRVQRIDIDDILAIEAGAPGNGVAAAMHEIEENFQAHGVPVVAGTSRFLPAHGLAETTAENPVATELVGPSRRVAVVQVPGNIVPTIAIRIMGMPINIPGGITPAANTTAIFVDYENYYLGITSRWVAATADNQIVNSRRFPKTVVSAATIDNFASGSNVIPAAGAAITAAAIATINANPTATVNVQGFSDGVGAAAANLTSSQGRADAVTAALVLAGVNRLRINSQGLGATNFVAANITAADRALNRRVVITITTPQL